jgi:hypothetical protein
MHSTIGQPPNVGTARGSNARSGTAATEPPLTATGHTVGARYRSAAHAMTYQVLGAATLWELAPGEAVRLRWSNGNETVTAQPVAGDVVVCVAGPDEEAAARTRRRPGNFYGRRRHTVGTPRKGRLGRRPPKPRRGERRH